jgi:hypothetical protein
MGARARRGEGMNTAAAAPPWNVDITSTFRIGAADTIAISHV